MNPEHRTANLERRTPNQEPNLNTNRAQRTRKREQPFLVLRLPLRRAEVGDGQLQIPLAVVGVVLEREGQVDRCLVPRNKAFASRGAPGDAAHDAAVLLEGHLEMAFLQPPRAVNDLDAA